MKKEVFIIHSCLFLFVNIWIYGNYEGWIQDIRSTSVFLRLDVFSGNSIKDGSAFFWNYSWFQFKNIVFGIFFDNFVLLELLETPSDNLSSSGLMFWWSAVNSMFSAIEMRKESDTSSRSQIDFSSQSSNSVINPVLIKGS